MQVAWHLSQFEPQELIRVAVQIERQGVDFYRQLAARVGPGEVQQLFLALAEEEEQHQADFNRLGQDLEITNPRDTYPGEYEDYVRSLVESHIFSDLAALDLVLSTAITPWEALELAMRLEKDSVLFFDGFRQLVKREKQGILNQLIAQEHSHLSRLANLRRQRAADR